MQPKYKPLQTAEAGINVDEAGSLHSSLVERPSEYTVDDNNKANESDPTQGSNIAVACDLLCKELKLNQPVYPRNSLYF
jgi:hypothetical protein